MLSSIPIFPTAASTFASDVDKLYFLILAVTSFFAIAVVIFVAIFAVKYQDHTGTQVGAPIHGSIPLELAWSFLPFVIAIGIFAYATVVYFEIVRPPAETLQIYSTGKRWMWRFQHINGRAEINELHVPKGRPVKITFTSEDVLHSLYFPSFRVKADAIPGRYSEIWFEAAELGDFHIFCAEYCGTSHSGMIGHVVVMEPRDYQAWLSGSDGQPLAARGQQLFQQLACVTCHLQDGSGRGPKLNGVPGSTVELANGTSVTADDGYIRESILTPQAKLVSGFQPVMPTFQGLVNEEGVMSLIEYIKSLPAPAAPAQSATAPAARPAQR
jgi:cytochrome c oxidase subunit 2